MWVTFFNLFKTENLVLWVRSELTDSAIDLIYSGSKGNGAQMGDKGKKDKGKREEQKKSKQTPKERRKQKKDKTKSTWAIGR